jgi:hypothetical protein
VANYREFAEKILKDIDTMPFPTFSNQAGCIAEHIRRRDESIKEQLVLVLVSAGLSSGITKQLVNEIFGGENEPAF